MLHVFSQHVFSKINFSSRFGGRYSPLRPLFLFSSSFSFFILTFFFLFSFFLFFLFFLLELGVGSAVQRHAAAPWRAWQSIIPTLMATTQSPDTDSLFNATPRLRAQLTQLQTTLSLQMNKSAFQLKPLGAALRLKTTQKNQVSTIQRNIHKQITTISPTSPLNAPSSYQNQRHTLCAPHAAQQARRMRQRTVASAFRFSGG